MMKNEPFHLGVALHSVWKMVIQIGVASWRNIWKSSEEATERIAAFKIAWTSTTAFCTMNNTLVWNFLPDSAFLPLDLAIQVASTSPTYQVTQISQSLDTQSTETSKSPSAHTNDMMRSRGRGEDYPYMGNQGNIDWRAQEIANLADPHHDWPNLPLDYSPTSKQRPTSPITFLERRRLASQHADNILRQILQEMELNVDRLLDDENQQQEEGEIHPIIDLDLQATFASIYDDITESYSRPPASFRRPLAALPPYLGELRVFCRFESGACEGLSGFATVQLTGLSKRSTCL